MRALSVRRSGPLTGTVRLPSDLSLGQESILWAALARGSSTIRGLSPYPDHRVLRAALAELGVQSVETEQGLQVAGVGLLGLTAPKGALSAESSRSSLELLSALLSGQRFGTRITVAPHCTQSVRTLVMPLRERGAMIAAQSDALGELVAPVSVAPLLSDERLREIEIDIPNGDPTTKRALLISGLFAAGITAINEGVLSRDHTERAFVSLGLPVETIGGMTLLDTQQAPDWQGFDWTIPGDFTLAAFLTAAASIVPGSDVRMTAVGVNPTRAAFLTALRHADAPVSIVPRGDMAGDEPVSDLRVQHRELRGLSLGGELALRMPDEIVCAMAVAVEAKSRTSIRDASFLRAGETDVLGRAAQLLRAFSVECTDYEDGCDIDPCAKMRGARVTADEPPPVALLGLILGLAAEGETVIEDAARLHALYPGLVDSLRSLGATIDEQEVGP